MQFGLRKGKNPQVCITAMPRPIHLLKQIIGDPGTIVTRGSTFDNCSNLSEKFLQTIRRKYEGTRLGRQELEAELLEDVDGALWKRGSYRSLAYRAPWPAAAKAHRGCDRPERFHRRGFQLSAALSAPVWE